jgi:Protein of unknown function (DUF3501)
MAPKLTLDDIADLRAYERERSAFLRHVVALKAKRRVAVGPIVTFVFENRDTVRFQVQEMARVEKLISDEAIQTELDIYNTLIPEPGVLSATMFIELTSEVALRDWLPRLVGIERAAVLELPSGDRVRSEPEPHHAAQLTDAGTTSSVHYLRFVLTPAQLEDLARGPVALAVDHPAYHGRVELGAETVSELVSDLRAGTASTAGERFDAPDGPAPVWEKPDKRSGQ